jgi:predicted flavoprotein YhiN
LKNLSEKTIAVVGTGPAGLMAAYVLASAGIQVTLFEKRKSSGRKLLIAGSSGLNISYDCPEETLFEHYRGPKEHFQNLFKKFSRSQWIAFVESLGLETFKGTSRRYFVREMKASGLLKAWTEKLKSLGVKFEFQKELTGFDVENGKAKVFFNQSPETFDAVCFCLGGGSWEPDESPLRWPKAFTEKSIAFTPFQSSNAGFEVAWPEAFLKEAEGKPIKSIVYALGATGTVHLDLKPDFSEAEILAKLKAPMKENLSPIRRVQKTLNLCEASQALLFHLTVPKDRSDAAALARRMKKFPIELKAPRPLAEAISSSGGIAWSEVTQELMLKKFPGIFLAGEMLDWDAPTGGFLIQGCVSQGFLAGTKMKEWFTLKS